MWLAVWAEWERCECRRRHRCISPCLGDKQALHGQSILGAGYQLLYNALLPAAFSQQGSGMVCQLATPHANRRLIVVTTRHGGRGWVCTKRMHGNPAAGLRLQLGPHLKSTRALW